MKKYPVIALIILTFILSACIPAKPPEPDTGPVLDAIAGEEFVVNLASNPTTGYRWALAKPLDHKILNLLKTEYQPSPGSQNRVGAGGREVWTFRAVGQGFTVIEFKYAREWEKDKPPARRHTLRVRVR